MLTSDRPRGLVVGVDDPHRADVRALLEAHLRFCRSLTPLCHAYALGAERLAGPDVTFFSAREGGVAVGVGAVKRLDAQHAELKSMHTAEAARGRGIGQALLEDLLGFARSEGYQRVSVETGTMEGFASARRLYMRAGFVPCGPFSSYTASPDNTFMTLELISRA